MKFRFEAPSRLTDVSIVVESRAVYKARDFVFLLEFEGLANEIDGKFGAWGWSHKHKRLFRYCTEQPGIGRETVKAFEPPKETQAFTVEIAGWAKGHPALSIFDGLYVQAKLAGDRKNCITLMGVSQ